MNYPRVARDLMEARSLIATFGWCRGAYSLPSGARCIETALADAIGGYGERFNAACALLRSVATDGLSPLEWNDRRHRTEDEVLKALDLAASAALSDLLVTP